MTLFNWLAAVTTLQCHKRAVVSYNREREDICFTKTITFSAVLLLVCGLLIPQHCRAGCLKIQVGYLA